MNAIGPASPDERDLMRSLHEGSPSALATLYERTAPFLFPLALRIVGTQERACAVIEDLFEEVWRDRARWRGCVEIPAILWIARCRELALAQVGPEPRRPATEAIAPFGVGVAAGEATHPARHDPTLTAARETAREALAFLPEADRRALEEAYFCGASAREVAVLIGAPTTDAAATLRSALVRFREHVAERESVEVEARSAS